MCVITNPDKIRKHHPLQMLYESNGEFLDNTTRMTIRARFVLFLLYIPAVRLLSCKHCTHILQGKKTIKHEHCNIPENNLTNKQTNKQTKQNKTTHETSTWVHTNWRGASSCETEYPQEEIKTMQTGEADFHSGQTPLPASRERAVKELTWGQENTVFVRDLHQLHAAYQAAVALERACLGRGYDRTVIKGAICHFCCDKSNWLGDLHYDTCVKGK